MTQLLTRPFAGAFTDGSLPAPGWLGFTVMLLLVLATVLLIRSMGHQLRKVPPSFDEPGDVPPPAEPKG